MAPKELVGELGRIKGQYYFLLAVEDLITALNYLKGQRKTFSHQHLPQKIKAWVEQQAKAQSKKKKGKK